MIITNSLKNTYTNSFKIGMIIIIMKNRIRTIINGNEIRYFCYFTLFLFYLTAFICDSPKTIMNGLYQIVLSRDVLITDYIELVGYGATLLNVAFVFTIAILAIEIEKIPYTGLTIAALFINVCFSFWGKNFLNVLPIIFGTYLYAHLQGSNFGRYIYNALFATCLAPFVTEVYCLLSFDPILGLFGSILSGLAIGFLIPPIAAHTNVVHMGYSLFNGGFAGGILAFILTCCLRSLNIDTQTSFVWKTGQDLSLIVCLIGYFLFTFIYGFVLEKGNIYKFIRVTRHPGRAIADFVLMDSPGATLMNMSFMSLLALGYVLFVGGDFSGPVIGCLFIVFGFSAFGAHPKNYIPVLLGVYLSTFITKYQANDSSLLIAALFSIGLSPIAGQFGVITGIIAGIVHSFVVVCTTAICGGFNLYNNGFSTGWVAILLVPTIESFMRNFKKIKRR